MYVIKLIGLAGTADPRGNAESTGFVKEYEPGPWNEPTLLKTVEDPEDALQFAEMGDVIACLRQENGVRPDGKANRPITAYTVSIDTVERFKEHPFP